MTFVPSHPFWRRTSWWRRSGSASGAHLIGHLLFFGSGVVAARGLGPTGYGAVILALSIAGFIVIFLDLTLEEALVYHGTKLRERDDLPGVALLFRRALILDGLLGIGTLIVVALTAAPVSRLVAAELPPTLIVLAAVQYVATTIDSTTGAALLIEGRSDLRARSGVIAGVTRLTLVAVAIALGAGTHAVVAVFAVGAAAGSATQAALAWRFAWSQWGEHPSTGILPGRDVLRFAIFSSVTGSLTAATAYVVPVVIGLSLPAEVVAQIAVGMLPLTGASLVTTQIRLAALPEQAALFNAGRHHQLRRSVVVLTLTLVSVSLPLVGAGYLLMPIVLPLVFGSAYEGAIWAARVLLLAMPFQFVSSWLKMLPSATGRPEQRTGVASIEFLLTVASVGSAAALWHREGAVVGYVAAQVVVALLWLAVTRRAFARLV